MKALLDAGVTCNDVTQCVGGQGTEQSRHCLAAFEKLDAEGIAVDQVNSGYELGSASEWVSNRGAHCVLMVASDKACLRRLERFCKEH